MYMYIQKNIQLNYCISKTKLETFAQSACCSVNKSVFEIKCVLSVIICAYITWFQLRRAKEHVTEVKEGPSYCSGIGLGTAHNVTEIPECDSSPPLTPVKLTDPNTKATVVYYDLETSSLGVIFENAASGRKT